MKKFAICPLNPTLYPRATILFEALGGWKPANSRVRLATLAAMCATITGEAKTGREAALAAGISDRTLYRYRNEKAGKIAVAHIEKLRREGAGQNAILNIIELAEQRKNLSVAMRANEWLAGINGISPVARSEIEHKEAPASHGMVVIHPDAAAPEMIKQLFGKRETDATRH